VSGMDEKRLEKKLEEIERDLHESWGNIKEPNNFDPIFHFIR